MGVGINILTRWAGELESLAEATGLGGMFRTADDDDLPSCLRSAASELDRLRAENAALREALEMIASPSGIEPRLWATYVARKALGQRITAFTLEWLESEEANRITMQAENAAVRRRVEDVAQWLRGCLGDPMRSRSPVVVIHKKMLLQAIIEPLEQALAAAKPAAQEGKEQQP